MVDSDGIRSKLFHQGSIKLALICVDQRIVGNKLIGNACCKIEVSARQVAAFMFVKVD